MPKQHKRYKGKFPANLGEPYKIEQGSYHINEFYNIKHNSELKDKLPGHGTVVRRRSIPNAPVMDRKRWENLYIDRFRLFLFWRVNQSSNQIKYIVPRIFFSTPKTEITEDESWYRLEHGASLSDPDRFPEGGDFPKHIFKQMVGIFPALAYWSEYHKPKTFREHLLKIGITTKQKKDGQVEYTVNQNGREVVVSPIERERINQYFEIVSRWQLKNKATIDQLTMGKKLETLYRQLPITGEEYNRWGAVLGSLLRSYRWFPDKIRSNTPFIDDDEIDMYAGGSWPPLTPPLLEEDDPKDGDTKAYGKDLGEFLDVEVYQKYLQEFDDEQHLWAQLFNKLGVPEQPLATFYRAAEKLHSRPFSYIHCDLHRKNLMVSEEKDQLIIMDWETLNVGDWVFDATKHVKKIRYNEKQKEQFWFEILHGEKRMPWKYFKDYREVEKDIPIYEMYLTIEEIIVMLIRCTQALAKGELTKEDPATHRNLHKLFSGLQTARAGYEGWEQKKEMGFDEVFEAIEYFVENTKNEKIQQMKQQRNPESKEEAKEPILKKGPRFTSPEVRDTMIIRLMDGEHERT